MTWYEYLRTLTYIHISVYVHTHTSQSLRTIFGFKFSFAQMGLRNVHMHEKLLQVRQVHYIFVHCTCMQLHVPHSCISKQQ